jgi:hypothetical protein
MRSIALVIVVLVVGCGSKAAPAPTPTPTGGAPRANCNDYARAADEASRTPAAPGDAVEVQVVNACGCAHAVSTTAAEATRVNAAHDAWTRAGCGPVNCDEPCPTPAPSPPAPTSLLEP